MKENAMSLRCKAGDIAIVEYDDPPCVGNIHHVVRVVGALKFYPSTQKHTWLIEPLSTPDWLVCNWPGELSAHRVSRTNCLKDRIEHPDAWLRPIRKTGFNSLAEIIEHVRQNPEQEQINHSKVLEEVLP